MGKIEKTLLGERLPKEDYLPLFDLKFRTNAYIGAALMFVGITMLAIRTTRPQSPLPLLLSAFFFVQAFRYYYYRTYGHYVILNGHITGVEKKMGRKNRVRRQRIYFAVSTQSENGELVETEYSCEVNANKWNVREGCPVMVCLSQNAQCWDKDGVIMISEVLAVNTSLNNSVGGDERDSDVS